MNEVNYLNDRQQLLRRAAMGDDITKALDKLDAERDAAQRAQKIAGDVERARQEIASETAKAAIEKQYGEVVTSIRDAAAKANALAERAEAALADAVTAFDAWRAAIEATRALGMQAHTIQMQGAKSAKLPVLPGTGELSVHLMRHAGVQFHQQILHTGKLPRAS